MTAPLRIGRYELDQRIAAGGMGEIHLARQAGPGGFSRKCVVKLMHKDVSRDPSFVKMFLSEARVTAHLTHPNIAQLYDFGEADGVYYLAMEYVPGLSLAALNRSWLDQRKLLPVAATLRFAAEAARALHYAHTALDDHQQPLGLVHRDVSPGNILVSTSGLVKLIDFGIAKVTASSHVTQDGVVKGKLQFMSPEQVAGLKVDARSDIYSLGLVAYELLSGKRAFSAARLPDLVMAVGRNEFVPLETARAGLSPQVYGVVAKALATRVDDRYPTAAVFADALESAVAATPPPISVSQLGALVTEAMAVRAKGEGAPTGPAVGPVPSVPSDVRRTSPHDLALGEGESSPTSKQLALGDADLPPTGEARPPFGDETVRGAPSRSEAPTVDGRPAAKPPTPLSPTTQPGTPHPATHPTAEILASEMEAAMASVRSVATKPAVPSAMGLNAVPRHPVVQLPADETVPRGKPLDLQPRPAPAPAPRPSKTVFVVGALLLIAALALLAFIARGR